jgi:hypothetical protein
VCAVRRALHKKQSFYKPSDFSGRGGRCVEGWLSVRGLFAMRGPMRGELVAMQCDAMRCTGCDARTNALRAGCIRAVQAAPCFLAIF